ncbi:sugar transferase [Ligilactobacillus murinus]|uniref:Sugar transferase n=1 Tax=Ligilactobacillus murinus TaxID=1622 RepID=A0AAE6WG99_9LACO|nr:sugar transferase [Ligilactobacillus murinus]NEF83780.1 sugar transferase [Ligilactobacillus murinus]NEF86090.1 sugar transferase [Ligilactobacillus murinus]NEF88371.1 sugar transferase [Ligilactobacillus murinus]NEF90635.1 sugar transferase [Ligilactobacillus murinus]NEF92870.1 sugar transferase [Ligilactobacillus murinus]
MTTEKLMLNKHEIECQHIYMFFKRIFDIILSAVGLLVLAIPCLIIALFIFACDRGPVFYTQERVGKDGKKFMIYKFRSMYVNADTLLEKLKEKNEVTGPMFKMKNDPRVTSVGRFLRKTSLDELPQLWNVLRGDMSVVGPRPPLPSEVREYSDYDKQRLWVIPGCTGLWQATERNNVGFSEMVDLDLTYIQHRSLLLDAKIILLTFLMIVRPKGAY